MEQGADISSNQWRAGLPFQARTAMIKQGIRFLIARASIGYQPDTAFAVTRERSGPFTLFGAYHYLVDALDAVRQADVFMQRVHDTGTIKGITTALDVEDDNTGPIHNHPSIQDVERWIRRFRDVHPNAVIAAYSNRATWFRLGNPDITSLGFDYAWHALYPGNVPPYPNRPPLAFGGEGRAAMWQYGPFRLNLANGRHLEIDGDVFYGTGEQLAALATGHTPPITPIPDRPRYKLGYNQLIDRLIIDLGTLQVPDPGSGPAWEAGVEDARQDASDALHNLRIGK